jgi:putative membrane protein insertion efficiency factor
MGHRNSSAQCHDAGCLCLDGGGSRGDTARIAPPNAVTRDGYTLVRTEIRTADSSLPSGGGRSLRNVANGTGAGLLLFGIRFYQAIFAHLMPIGCKFYPSCSRYAAEAIERHGAARGARLALARLWRCRPFTQGGFDPVPGAHEVANGAAEAASPSASEAEGGVRAEVSS